MKPLGTRDLYGPGHAPEPPNMPKFNAHSRDVYDATANAWERGAIEVNRDVDDALDDCTKRRRWERERETWL